MPDFDWSLSMPIGNVEFFERWNAAPSKLPRLMVLGHGRHGKDTVCEYLRERFGFRFVSSSRFVGEKAVWPRIKHRYENFEQAYEARNRDGAERQVWFAAICDYNKNDPARLTRELYADGNDIYCGLRNRTEYVAAAKEGLFDYSIWIDASARMPPEPKTSITVLPTDADYVVNNNDSITVLHQLLNTLVAGMLSQGAIRRT